MAIKLEYLWLDGEKSQRIRSKTMVYREEINELKDVPIWGFDGSSTLQAEGKFSDCILRPVALYNDPIRSGDSRIILCEVFNQNGSAHETNTRRGLAKAVGLYPKEEFWFGVEQEYVMLKDGKPLGFPKEGFPAPQGKYYCSNGADRAYGREISERHLDACLDADILIAGVNAEVMPGQWEYQIGAAAPLKVADDLIVAKYLLHRIGEEYGVTMSFDPKPVKGDWNGSGAHVNFSTNAMRESLTDETIAALMKKFEARHKEHIAVYGENNHERLTGKHETCSIDQFRYGVSDRGGSVRIPWKVAREKKGYLEDRRPAANLDPYLSLERIMRTVCE